MDDYKISKIENKTIKQSMALLSMKFIRNKTVFYEMHNYELFIIFNEEVMGYFTRRKGGINSLSCLFVVPCFQKQGLGSLLIDYSYGIRISKTDYEKDKESITNNDRNENYELNGPEKPFSKKAIFCYRKYWAHKVKGYKTIREIAENTNMSLDDIIVGLELNGFDFINWKMNEVIQQNKPRIIGKKIYRLVNDAETE